MARTPPCVLTVAGSDSSGGAGIQADLKTVLALGGHGMSVICAVTAQNSQGVHGSWVVPPEAVRAQLDAVLGDVAVQAVKTGMLGSGETAGMVADALAGLVPPVPLVVDPVAVSSHGDVLAPPAALAAMRERLLPLATVVTPNLGEAALLTGMTVDDEAGMVAAAQAIRSLGPRWVLVKGGHLASDPVDVLTDGDRVLRYRGTRLQNRHTHGTGCTLASAIATYLASGEDVPTAVELGRQFVAGAIRWGFPLGSGTGPVDHGWGLRHAPQRGRPGVSG